VPNAGSTIRIDICREFNGSDGGSAPCWHRVLVHNVQRRPLQSVPIARAGNRSGRAWSTLREGRLLDPITLARLPADAEHDAASRHEQHERQTAYLEWRERAARQLARSAGPLGRLTHRPEDFYAQLDRERLRVCRRCTETIYPGARESDGYGLRPEVRCHYCREPHATEPYQATSTTRKESEAQL
jgi:hypothetical protein